MYDPFQKENFKREIIIPLLTAFHKLCERDDAPPSDIVILTRHLIQTAERFGVELPGNKEEAK